MIGSIIYLVLLFGGIGCVNLIIETFSKKQYDSSIVDWGFCFGLFEI